MYKKYLLFIAVIVLVLFTSTVYALSTYNTLQGGTGTTSPSGILYGDNNATQHLNTVTIGSGCSFSTGTLSCAGTGSGTFPFTSQSWGNSTSTTIGFLNGLLSTASSTFTATTTFTNGATFTTAGGLVGIGTLTPKTILEISSPLPNQRISITDNSSGNIYGGIQFGNTSSNAGDYTGEIGSFTFTGNNYATVGEFAPNDMAFQYFGTDKMIFVNRQSAAIEFLINGFTSAARAMYIDTNKNVTMGLNGGFVGIGTSTPGSLLSIGATGTGINFYDNATSTFTKGINIANGCYAIGGVCLSGSGGSGLSSYDAWTHPVQGRSATTSLMLFNGNASSTGLSANYAAFGSTGTTTITASGNVGIGITSPSVPLVVTQQSSVQTPVSGSTVQFVGLDANPLRLTFDTNNGGTSGTALMFRNSGGTAATPSATVASAVLGSLNFRGYGTTGYSAGSTGLISAKNESASAFTDSSMPTAVTIDTTPLNSVTATEKFRVSGNGNVGIGTTSPGSLLSIGNNGGINFSPTATSTFSGSANGINITNGCFAIAGTCIGSGSGSGTVNSGLAGQNTYYAADGTAVSGTSTIFMAINSNVGIATTTPTGLFTISPRTFPMVSTNPAFLIGTSTLASPSANGTYIGVNTPASFSGNFIDLQNNGVSKFGVSSGGNITTATGVVTSAIMLQLSSSVNIANASIAAINHSTGSMTVTSGDSNMLLMRDLNAANPSFKPTTGSATFTTLRMANAISQSGTAVGITRGLYILPILTGAADYRAMEIGTTTFNLNQSTTTLTSFLQYPFVVASTTAATVTNTATHFIAGPPRASTNITISTSTALLIGGGSPVLGATTSVLSDTGTGAVTNAYGLQVFAPVGGVNNYAASFMNGNVGVGTSTPWKAFSSNGNVAMAGLNTATLQDSLCINPTTKEIVDSGSGTCSTSSKFTKDKTGEVTPEVADYIVNHMQAITFKYKGQDNQHYGFIAEDVAALDKEVQDKFGVDARLAEYAKTDLPNYEVGDGTTHSFKKGDPISVEYANYTAVLTVYMQNHVNTSSSNKYEDIAIALLALGMVGLYFKKR